MKPGKVINKRVREKAAWKALTEAEETKLDPAQVFTNKDCQAWFDGEYLCAQVWVVLTRKQTTKILKSK